MATVGEAKLKLSADGSSLPTEVRAAVAAAMRGINETLKVEVDADVTPFEAKMATVLRPREVDVDVDVDRTAFDRFLRDMDRADKDFVVRVALLGDTNVGDRFSDQTVGVRLDIQNAGAFNAQMDWLTRPRQVDVGMNVDQSQLGALGAVGAVQNRTVDIRANVTNTAQVEAQLAALTRDRTVNIDIDVNHSQIHMAISAMMQLGSIGMSVLGSLGSAFSGFGSSAGAASSTLSMVSSGFSNVASAAGMAVQAVGMVGVAAMAAGAAAGGIPIALAGAMGAVSAAAGAMAAAVTGGIGAAIASMAILGNEDLKNKMTSTFDAIKTSMQEIAQGAAPALSRFFDALPAAFERMRPALENITQGVSGLIDHLTGKLPAIADQLGPALEKAFNAGVPHMENLIDNLPRMTEAFGNFMSQLGDPQVVEAANRMWSMLPGAIEKVGEAIPAVAQGFNELMGWIDEGNLDPFIRGFKDLWNELSSADWSGVVASAKTLADSFGNFLSSIDGQGVADALSGIAFGLAGIMDAATAASDAMSSLWDVIGPKNVIGELNELNHAMLGMIKKTFGKLPFIGDDITKAVDAALSQMRPVKFRIEPEVANKDKVFRELGAGPPAKVKVTPEIDWTGSGTKGPSNTFKSIKIPAEVEVQPFKLDIPPKQKVMVDVETTPFKLDIPPKTKVMVDVEQTAGFKLDIPAKTKVMVEPDGSGFFNFRPPQPPPVKVKVEADASGFSADVDAKTKVFKTVTVPIAYQVPPFPALPSPPPIRVEVQTNADEVAGKINSIPGSKVTTHTVNSNVGAVIGQIASMQAGTSSFHTVSSNVGAVLAQINSLNGRNTSSTHTIRTVETGKSKQMADGGFNFRSYANGGITALEKYANGKLPSAATIMRPRRRLIQWAEPQTKGEAFIPLARSKRARSVDIWARTGQLLGLGDQVSAALAARHAAAPNLTDLTGGGSGGLVGAAVGSTRVEVHAPITISGAHHPASTGRAVRGSLTRFVRN